MSDLLEAAAAALGTPSSLVQRSAAARASASGASVDDVLASWAGDAPPPAPAATPEPSAAAEPETTQPEPEPASTAVAVMEAPEVPQPPTEVVVADLEPEEPLEPVSIGDRLATATRIGAWLGAGLGVIAFLFASAFWADSAGVESDAGPFVVVDSQGVLIGVALVSVLFGAIVAGFSRAAAGWSNPAMQLTNSKSSTAWIGALIGLVLGVIAGALLTSGFGETLDGDEGLVQLPVLATMAVIIVGGAVLGAVTAAVPQLVGTPVAVEDADVEEVAQVKNRLGTAIGVPLAAAVLLIALVVPFGYLLIESNHLSSGGASIVAILTSAGILGFAALAGSKPEMKITLGDLIWAILGLGTVLVLILAVLFYTGSDDHGEEEHSEEAAVVQLI